MYLCENDDGVITSGHVKNKKKTNRTLSPIPHLPHRQSNDNINLFRE